jgi:hypothetical protein
MFGMTRTQRIHFALIFCALIAACGGDRPTSPDRISDRDEDSVPSAGQPVVIRSGARMAWDQAAPSVQAARAYTYRLFVNGALSTLTDTRCDDRRTDSGYECSGVLPAMPVGQHTIEIAAVSGSVQSITSVPLTVRVTGT